VNKPSEERWNRLWKLAGVASAPPGWYDRLNTLYSEAHRHYHNWRHISECLREFDSAKKLAACPAAVEFAIWFHDAIYDPRAPDNEEKSALLATQCLSGTALARDLINEVAQLILATKHHVTSQRPDAALLLDVDLSILGQPEGRFVEYERQIRDEYAWVPEATFNAKRAEILERFLVRGRIFVTPWFFDRYETAARANLQRSIQNLK
jgi:predicted metal-dependent HD superfamily phosphohydrolase